VAPRKKTKLPDAEIDSAFRPIVAAFADYRDVIGGKMMSSYGLKVNGRIFAMFGREQFVVNLLQGRVDSLLSTGNGKRFDPGHGRPMKEWIVVAEGGPKWLELTKEAYSYVKRTQ
jgi:hypothetical protein